MKDTFNSFLEILSLFSNISISSQNPQAKVSPCTVLFSLRASENWSPDYRSTAGTSSSMGTFVLLFLIRALNHTEP